VGHTAPLATIADPNPDRAGIRPLPNRCGSDIGSAVASMPHVERVAWRYLGGALTRQSGISNPHQSGPRMKGANSDWLVYNLNLLLPVPA
jgi:hypothetical protein